MKTADNTRSICPFCQNGTIPNEPKLPIGEEVYWKERCLAAEEMIKQGTLVQNFGDKGVSYTPSFYEAREKLHKLQQTQPLSTEVEEYGMSKLEMEISFWNREKSKQPSTPPIKEEKVSTGLDELIEWVEFESNRRWNESHELPDFTEILAKAKEIKSRLNK